MTQADMNVLVLDVGFQPIGVVPWERAITLWWEKKVEIVNEYSDMWIHSAKIAMRIPSIVRFLSSIKKKTRKVKFSRDNVYTRDKGKCQYCSVSVSRHEFTLDHVQPKSQKGKTTFENVVVSCVDCNRAKADKSLAQSGMKLKQAPVKPKNLFQSFSWMETMPEDWKTFIVSVEYWNGELLNDIT